jgi:uncharacterized lipoprotein YbaY
LQFFVLLSIGSVTSNGRRPCDLARSNSKPGLLGAFTPNCKSDGSFEEKQCHGSTGYCWCVDTTSGVEIKGTRKGPGQGQVLCRSAECMVICPLVYAPVCANNGETFGNMCWFNAQKKCRNLKDLKVVKMGRCSTVGTLKGVENMTVRGLITTQDNTSTYSSKLPTSSCAKVSLDDVSLADAPSVPIAYKTIQVSNADLLKGVYFNLNAKKPLVWRNRRYGLSVTVNVGWCAEDKAANWIKEGDYVTGSHHAVPLSSNVVEYSRDVVVECYACGGGRNGSSQSTSVPQCSVMCLNVYNPVCGTNGITYNNKCKLVQAKVCGKVDVKVASLGPCDSGRTLPSAPRARPYPTKFVKVSGDIVFPDLARRLPQPSCVVVKLNDVTDGRTSSYILSTMQYNVMGDLNQQKLKYSLYTAVPCQGENEEGQLVIRTLSVNVVLNVGWCQDNQGDWVRPGDYISTNNFQVNLQRNNNLFFKNVQLECHECTNLPPPGPSLCETARTNTGPGMVGGFAPNCKLDGSFEEKQCHSSTGNCWCVDTETGDEIQGTRRGPGEDPVVCVKPVCSIVCPDEYRPVCASDGQTFDNMCWLNSTKKCDNLDIQVQYEGRCKDDSIDKTNKKTGEPGERFSGGVPPTKILTGEVVTVKGKVILPEQLAKLPDHSCLKIRVKDISDKDVFSHVLATKVHDLSKKSVGRKFDYVLKFRRPMESHENRGYTLAAVLNIGWCHQVHKHPWIRVGDFLSVVHHTIKDSTKTEYTKDILIECYGCGERNVTIPGNSFILYPHFNKTIVHLGTWTDIESENKNQR